MGRRKPLSAQQKHLTKKEIKEKELEEESVFVGNEQLEVPPNWLINDIAEREWKRLVEEFSKKSLISNLDYNNLGAYCNAYAKYIEATKEVGLNFMIGMTANPMVQIELKYSDEMKRYGALLGLTSESRLKLGAITAGEGEKRMENEFGDV